MVAHSVIINMDLLTVTICVLDKCKLLWLQIANLYQTAMCINHIVIVVKLTVLLCRQIVLLVCDAFHVPMAT